MYRGRMARNWLLHAVILHCALGTIKVSVRRVRTVLQTSQNCKMSSSEFTESESEYSCVEDDGELGRVDSETNTPTSVAEQREQPNSDEEQEYLPYQDEPLADEEWLRAYNQRQEAKRELEGELTRRLNTSLDVSDW